MVDAASVLADELRLTRTGVAALRVILRYVAPSGIAVATLWPFL